MKSLLFLLWAFVVISAQDPDGNFEAALAETQEDGLDENSLFDGGDSFPEEDDGDDAVSAFWKFGRRWGSLGKRRRPRPPIRSKPPQKPRPAPRPGGSSGARIGSNRERLSNVMQKCHWTKDYNFNTGMGMGYGGYGKRSVNTYTDPMAMATDLSRQCGNLGINMDVMQIYNLIKGVKDDLSGHQPAAAAVGPDNVDGEQQPDDGHLV